MRTALLLFIFVDKQPVAEGARPRLDCASPIRLLLFAGSPSAIAWFVVAVIIDALQREIRRRLTAHISDEILERLPSLANSDAAASVVYEVPSVGIHAPLFHCRPCDVLTGVYQAMAHQAATTAGSPQFYARSLRDESVATMAEADVVIDASSTLTRNRFNGNTVECTANNIQFRGHSSNRTSSCLGMASP